MYRIAIIDDEQSALGFGALGLEVFPADDGKTAGDIIKKLAKENVAVIYLAEHLAAGAQEVIDAYADAPRPAIILIPGREGAGNLGMQALKRAVERAVGADIMET